MKTIFITGVNRGIGLELAKQYLAEGHAVHGIARSPLKVPLSSLRLHEADVTDWKALSKIQASLSHDKTSFDLLINNAGIYGGDTQDLGNVTPETLLRTFTVNSVAPLMMVQTFLPLLKEGSLVCSITSLMGSIDDNTSGGYYAYRASKAALNMMTKSLSVDLKNKDITAIVMHPGWVKTDMGGPGAPVTPEESVTGIRKVLDSVTPSDSGKFFNFRGKGLPW